MSDIGKVTELTEVQSIAAFLNRNGLQMTGMRRASKTVMENGYPKEEYTVTFKEGAYAFVKAPLFMFEDGEKDRIIDDLRTTILPLPIPYPNESMSVDAPEQIKGVKLDPRAWKNIDWGQDKVLCPIHDINGNVVLIEQRYRNADGEKICVRWSYHDDFKWRHQDPDVFPFWGMDQLGNGATTVFLHEGPKAASAGRRFYEIDANRISERQAIKDHPWYSELSKHPHIGWIGGANRADRTNWRALKGLGVKRVIVVPDNDPSGYQSSIQIAEYLTGIEVLTFPQYPDYFPVGWDLADGFDKIDAKKSEYVNRHLPVDDWEEIPKHLIDITRITKSWADEKGKLHYEIVEGQPKGLAYLRETDTFTILGRPDVSISWDKLPHYYAGNIHRGAATSFSKMVGENINIHYEGYTFEPERGLVITDESRKSLNIWRPTKIQETPMDEEGEKMWDWYLKQLVPDPIERAIFRRWIATVLVKPRRKHFGVVLHTATQGTGKTTLFDEVLLPIIGRDFVVAPTSDDLAGRFTDWREGKTLIYADEIAGTKQMTTGDIYNSLKTWVTAPEARIEKKGQPVYHVPDYSKILINSNKDVPLYIEGSDRRWLVIRGNEKKMSRDEVSKLRGWLAAGGREMILFWARRIESDPKAAISAEDAGEAVMDTLELDLAPKFLHHGANAPMTDSKIELREKSTPLYHQIVMKILRDLETRFNDDGSTEVIPVALPSVVVEQQVMDALEKKGQSVSQAKILAHIAVAGWWYCEAKQKSKRYPDLARRTIRGMGIKRFTVIMNDKAMELLKGDGTDSVVDIMSPTDKKYVPKKRRNVVDKTDRKEYWDFNDVIDSLDTKVNGIPVWRPYQIMMSEDERVWGTDWD